MTRLPSSGDNADAWGGTTAGAAGAAPGRGGMKGDTGRDQLMV